MEFFGLDRAWFSAHGTTLVLFALVIIQWIAFQALLIHYHLFRQSLKKPTPDGIRFATIEKVLSFQATQIDRIYGKLSELNKEIQTQPTAKPAPRPAAIASDSSFVTRGELNLKKRLQELRQSGIEFPTNAKSTKLS